MNRQNDTETAATLDRLIATQARLQFAQGKYDEAEATQYGVDVLDFIRKHGIELRAALSAPAPQAEAAPDGLRKVAAEMLLIAPTCESDWDAQLREWAGRIEALAAPQASQPAPDGLRERLLMHAGDCERSADMTTDAVLCKRQIADMAVTMRLAAALATPPSANSGEVLAVLHDCAMRLRSTGCAEFAKELDTARATVAALLATPQASPEDQRLRKLVVEALTKVANDRTLWVGEWQEWQLDAHAALSAPQASQPAAWSEAHAAYMAGRCRHGELDCDTCEPTASQPAAGDGIAELIEAARDVERRAGPDREPRLRAALGKLAATPPTPAGAVRVDDAMVGRALDAQPFTRSRNSSARVWQLMLDERDAREIMRAALTAALAQPAAPSDQEAGNA